MKRKGRKQVVFKIGRNAGNGRFTPVKKARAKPGTHVVEVIRRPR